MSWLTVGKEFTSPMLGNPHALAVEDMGMETPKIVWPKKKATAPGAPTAAIAGWSRAPASNDQAKITDAVIAASNVLNSVRTDSSVMGHEGKPPEVDEIDKMVLATANSALAHREGLGPVRLVRLGLFVDDWRQMRSILIMKSFLDELARQKTGEFRSRAYAWANEVHNAVEAERIRNTKPLPWRKIFIGVGIVAAILAALKLYASFRDREATTIDHDPATPEHIHDPVENHIRVEAPMATPVEKELKIDPEHLAFQPAA